MSLLLHFPPAAMRPRPLAGLYGCWTYDSIGNRTLNLNPWEAYSTASSTPCAAGANANAQYTATPQSAAANNRLASTLATYDGAGNVIADSRQRIPAQQPVSA